MELYTHRTVGEIAADSMPAIGNWNTVPLTELMAHIVSRHHQHLKLELPRLQQCLSTVYATYRVQDGAMLAPLPEHLFLMKTELDLHMHKEELTLFPAIEEWERAAKAGDRAPWSFGSLASLIRAMLSEHDSTADDLAETRRITCDYQIPPYACDTYRALFRGLEALERNLYFHMDLENNILFPRAMSLECERI